MSRKGEAQDKATHLCAKTNLFHYTGRSEPTQSCTSKSWRLI